MNTNELENQVKELTFHGKEKSVLIESLKAELAEEQRRLHEANENWQGALREHASMSHRYEAAAELNKRLQDVLKSVLVFVENEQQCRETSYLPEPTADEEPYLIEASDAVRAIRTAIADAEAALANEVPHEV